MSSGGRVGSWSRIREEGCESQLAACQPEVSLAGRRIDVRLEDSEELLDGFAEFGSEHGQVSGFFQS